MRSTWDFFTFIHGAFQSEVGMEKRKRARVIRMGPIGGGIFGGRPHRCELRTGNPHAMAIFAAYKSAERACRAALPTHAYTHAHGRPIMLYDDHGTPGWLGCAGDLCSLIYVASPVSRMCITIRSRYRFSARAPILGLLGTAMGDFIFPMASPVSHVCTSMYVGVLVRKWIYTRRHKAFVVSHLC